MIGDGLRRVRTPQIHLRRRQVKSPSSGSRKVAIVRVTRSRRRQGHASSVHTRTTVDTYHFSPLNSIHFFSSSVAAAAAVRPKSVSLSPLIIFSGGCVKLSQYCFQKLFCERMIDKDMGMGVDVVEKSENNNQNGVAWCCIGQAVVFGYGG
ncbi:hypothetical protein Ddye_002190 [Dipteronia dyeriana]|uniref:Uncharacterized protein n=1 Tax=Dipteronia dyeriana TaxID=168575 RepID=A0AAD9XPV1_9ROSI|nr:hypothetical protein Ddye_002190 [Dipteronia dyeriana]